MSPQVAPASPFAWADLRGWNLYFLSKVVLAWMGALDLKILPNLLFLGALLVPLRWRWARIARTVAAVPVGVALYYQDTWWPPFRRLLVQPGVLDFSADYWLELAQRFINWQMVAVLAMLVLAYVLLKPWLRITTLSVLGMLGLAVMAIPMPAGWNWGQGTATAATTSVAGTSGGGLPPANNETLNAWLAGFYQQQASLKTSFPAPGSGAPFDVIILNICSLAWSDLDEVGLRQNNLLDHMDVVFDDFNSATAYSGPAAIRLLRASCGQTSHTGLFDPVPAECQLFSNLQRLGFQSELAMNHDGHFDDFIGELHQYGGLQAQPMDISAFPKALVAFDKSPLRRDGDVLMAWWKQRLAGSSQQVALFYNTISLHDGNRIVGADGRSNAADYKARAEMVLGDMAGFVDAVEKSGRRAMIVVVPEHGAALHGDRMQIPGMREIPSPSITHVPVGVKLIGMGAPAAGGPRHVPEPSSYLAVSELVSRVYALNAQSPPSERNWDSLLKGLPQTPSVSENEGAKVIEYAGKPWLQLQGSQAWSPYPEEAR
ncbi:MULTISPECIES: cellulose biosynthesis protein BcsG [Stenotrophomonas]|uniref:cellulose biosynthesis protein BcsG n=1 Tax=Stenotrophomonas TaxID=40323 RepID=UPI0004CEA93D|nr:MULTISPECIES: cellulose biosynthesis protein BcsG [Stenotrophomonas]MCR1006260.1 cellulose biosynthesis protein BcsG [Stenotrophomonas maltophilia]MCR1570598.1 cellulose biosynthesis protein BcsG [Stenotrophomonas sp.]PZT08745.1 cellulose synthase [Stenotrophomonas maltophilia]PZT43122.1 cellulose synthase [Stenotrophomonas maltophilia]UXB24746.1 cellulose biosynthesis protein BcsG [Stenotrophomonas maltophilia]